MSNTTTDISKLRINEVLFEFKDSSAYRKLSSGIPKEDLNEAVQSSLDKADTLASSWGDKQDKITEDNKLNAGLILGLPEEVYVGSDEPISNQNIWIDPNAEPVSADTEAVNEAITNIKKESTQVGTGNVSVTYSQTNGIVTISDIAIGETTAAFVEGDEPTLTVAEADKNKLLKASAIEEIVKYVDAAKGVGEIVTKVSVDNADPAVNIGIVSSSEEGEITLKVSSLGLVGLQKNGDGVYIASEGNTATGLAVAADVATEIVNDELVIASALNDHEDRLRVLEERGGDFSWIEDECEDFD